MGGGGRPSRPAKVWWGGEAACSVGGPNMETNTFSQISKQVNLMVDACYNIVKSKNITIEISQKMNKSVFSFSISIDANKKRKKKSIKKEEKIGFNKKKMPRNN